MIPILISGGSGKRLWPFSRTFYPKQFCDLFEKPLIIATAERVRNLGSPLIVTNQNFRALTEKTFGRYRSEFRGALYEPLSKNTAPAVAFLTRYLEEHDLLDEVVVIVPCDHVVRDLAEWNRALARAGQAAATADTLVVLGITPDYPATGYGYILTQGSDDARPVDRFEEKPSHARAELLLQTKTVFGIPAWWLRAEKRYERSFKTCSRRCGGQ